MNKLNELADACNAGACNVSGLLVSLGEAIKDEWPGSLKGNPALKCIIGHISYLLGESLGPTSEALKAYEESKIEKKECPNCKGSGSIAYNPNLNPNAFPATTTAKCGRCGGLGYEVKKVEVEQ